MKNLLILLTLLFVHETAAAVADPLSELINSPEMSRLEQRYNPDEVDGPRWLKPGTEFAALFTVMDGFLNLNTWVAPVSGTFVAGSQQGIKQKEYVQAERVYSSSKTADIKVRILVPHPKYVSMLQFGLIQAFAEMEPPRLQFENQEELEIKGKKASLYTLKNGGCSLIMTAFRSTKIEVSQPECRSLKDLVSLAELLDYKRLERKLNS